MADIEELEQAIETLNHALVHIENVVDKSRPDYHETLSGEAASDVRAALADLRLLLHRRQKRNDC